MNPDLKNYIFFLFSQAVRILFAAAGMAILARFLGPEGLGRWSMITAAGTLVYFLLLNWVQQEPLVRFGKEELTKTGTITQSWNARIPMLLAGVLISLLLFIMPPWPWLNHFFQLSRQDSMLALCFFIGLLVTMEMQTLLQTVGKMARMATVPALITIGTTLFYLVLWFMNLTHHRLLACSLGTFALTVTVWCWAGYSDFSQLRWNWKKWDIALMKKMVLYAWPILPATTLGYFSSWGGQLLIQHKLGYHEVGLYQTAFQVHALLVSMATPLTTLLLPRLIGKSIENPVVVKRYVTVICPTILCLWSLAVIPLVFLMPSLFSLIFGESFTESIGVLKWLLLTTPLCAIGQLYTVLYSLQGKLSKIFMIQGAMTVLSVTVAWVFLDRFGIPAAGAAFSVAFLCAQFVTYFYQHRTLHVPMAKTTFLFFSLLLCSSFQFLLTHLWLQVLGGIVGVIFLILVARGGKIVDPELLEQLLAGRWARIVPYAKSVLVGPGRNSR